MLSELKLRPPIVLLQPAPQEKRKRLLEAPGVVNQGTADPLVAPSERAARKDWRR